MHERTHSPGAGNGSQADHKRNNNAIQTRKLSQYIARSAGKSKKINFQGVIFLKITSILVSASSWTLEPCYLKTSQGVIFLKITSILVSASSWTLEPCYLKTSQGVIFLKITSILVSASSWTLEPCYLKTSQTFTFMPYVKSAEKLLREHEVQTITNFVSPRGASDELRLREGCRGVRVMGRPSGERRIPKLPIVAFHKNSKLSLLFFLILRDIYILFSFCFLQKLE